MEETPAEDVANTSTDVQEAEMEETANQTTEETAADVSAPLARMSFTLFQPSFLANSSIIHKGIIVGKVVYQHKTTVSSSNILEVYLPLSN